MGPATTTTTTTTTTTVVTADATAMATTKYILIKSSSLSSFSSPAKETARQRSARHCRFFLLCYCSSFSSSAMATVTGCPPA